MGMVCSMCGRMGERRSTYKVFVGNPEERGQLKIPGYR
jgi:hypothetical protein